MELILRDHCSWTARCGDFEARCDPLNAVSLSREIARLFFSRAKNRSWSVPKMSSAMMFTGAAEMDFDLLLKESSLDLLTVEWSSQAGNGTDVMAMIQLSAKEIEELEALTRWIILIQQNKEHGQS